MATMSLKIVSLMENPFYISDIIALSAKYYKKRKLNLWEIYKIIPLFFNYESRKIFFNTNSSGRIEKLFLKKEYLLGILIEEEKYYKDLINKGLIIALNQKKISIDKNNGEIYFSKKLNLELDSETEKTLKILCGVLSKEKISYILSLLEGE